MNKVLGFVGVLLILGALNYSGFCFKTMSYLSDDEKIEIAVDYILESVKKTYLEKNKNMDGYNFYQDAADFLEANPNCCEVAREFATCGVHDDCFTLEGILGRHSSEVYIEFQGPLFYSKGTKGAIAITNCGDAWNASAALAN